MPLPIPNLDDRTFDQLVDEAKALIPKHFPAWTDHNFSDPGITFLELFAFLIESAIYQINRVPERSLEHFASLLGVARGSGESIEMLFRRVSEKLGSRERAVTQDEIVQQVLDQNREIARAEVVIELQPAPGVFPAELKLNVIIVPKPNADDLAPRPSPELRQDVFKFLRERVPICTRLQVLAPQYSLIHLSATVVRGAQSRLDRATVHQNVVKAVRNFLDPIHGGTEGRGWPLGRSIFRSELYAVIEGLPGVDHVRELLLLDAQMRTSEKSPVYSSAADHDESPETRSELRLRDTRFPHARPLVEWHEEPFDAIVQNKKVRFEARIDKSFVVTVVDQ